MYRERILTAYEKTGLKPMRGKYLDREMTCGCAVGAMAMAACGINPKQADVDVANFTLTLPVGHHGAILAGFDQVVYKGKHMDVYNEVLALSKELFS